MEPQLSDRQQEILRKVVERYVATGEPVGSKTLVAHGGLPVSASTVRHELAELELLGLLTHPHTSAGRVPTERAYRLYANALLGRVEPRPPALVLDFSTTRTEIESALQRTTEMLADVTRLLALVSAPPLDTTVARHIEVLLLQPRVAVVVVITSTGGVTKRVIAFDEPVDPGLAAWARDYLNERVAGMRLGARLLRARFEDPSLGGEERTFLEALRPAFTDLVGSEDQRLYVGGAASLLGEARGAELEACHRLLEALERRAELLRLVGDALEPGRAFVRMGEDLGNPALRDVAFVGAGYGLGTRPLGAIGLLGPVRMNYGNAIRTVRAASHALSRYVEEVYGDG
jgi:heat-inducible transcriptional repressor